MERHSYDVELSVENLQRLTLELYLVLRGGGTKTLTLLPGETRHLRERFETIRSGVPGINLDIEVGYVSLHLSDALYRYVEPFEKLGFHKLRVEHVDETVEILVGDAFDIEESDWRGIEAIPGNGAPLVVFSATTVAACLLPLRDYPPDDEGRPAVIIAPMTASARISAGSGGSELMDMTEVNQELAKHYYARALHRYLDEIWTPANSHRAGSPLTCFFVPYFGRENGEHFAEDREMHFQAETPLQFAELARLGAYTSLVYGVSVNKEAWRRPEPPRFREVAGQNWKEVDLKLMFEAVSGSEGELRQKTKDFLRLKRELWPSE